MAVLRAAILAALLFVVNAQYSGTFNAGTGPDFYGTTGTYGSGVPAQSYIKLTGRCVGMSLRTPNVRLCGAPGHPPA